MRSAPPAATYDVFATSSASASKARPATSRPLSTPTLPPRADRSPGPEHGPREHPAQAISRRTSTTPRISNRGVRVSDILELSDWVTGRSVAAQRPRIRPPATRKTRGTRPTPARLPRSGSVPPKGQERFARHVTCALASRRTGARDDAQRVQIARRPQRATGARPRTRHRKGILIRNQGPPPGIR